MCEVCDKQRQEEQDKKTKESYRQLLGAKFCEKGKYYEHKWDLFGECMNCGVAQYTVAESELNDFQRELNGIPKCMALSFFRQT